MSFFGVEHSMDAGGVKPYQFQGNSEYKKMSRSCQILGAKVQNQEGNSPDRLLRSLKKSKWKRSRKNNDNQEVGLEAAILVRVRNSSMV